jgi:hypothetical protein
MDNTKNAANENTKTVQNRASEMADSAKGQAQVGVAVEDGAASY